MAELIKVIAINRCRSERTPEPEWIDIADVCRENDAYNTTYRMTSFSPSATGTIFYHVSSDSITTSSY